MPRLMQKWQSTKPSKKSKFRHGLLNIFYCNCMQYAISIHFFFFMYVRAKKKRMTKEEELAQRVIDRKARKAELEKARGFR